MPTPIIDLHCDLLAYLRVDLQKHCPLDPISNCSIPQLEAGHVRLQTLAMFTETRPKSHQKFLEQLKAYHQMLANFSGRIYPITDWNFEREQTHFILAIENASGLLEEGEDLSLFRERLTALDDPVLYVSLTWNEENRFGGGNHSQVGLKRDGEIALEVLAEKGILIDFSHTSDHLADDILNYIHKKGLNLKPLASHSNFRSVFDCPRNLPNTIAKEIALMGGLIGINFIRMFIGDHEEDFLKHLHHGIDLVGEGALALGGDIFGGIDVSRIAHLKPFFQKNLDTSACYPHFLKLLEKIFSSEQIKKIAYGNAISMLVKQELINN